MNRRLVTAALAMVSITAAAPVGVSDARIAPLGPPDRSQATSLSVGSSDPGVSAALRTSAHGDSDPVVSSQHGSGSVAEGQGAAPVALGRIARIDSPAFVRQQLIVFLADLSRTVEAYRVLATTTDETPSGTGAQSEDGDARHSSTCSIRAWRPCLRGSGCWTSTRQS
jgi:hypothetical protein